MLIGRRGHGADHGWRSIELKDLEIRWQEEDKCIHLSAQGIGDFTGNATHDYGLDVSVDELGTMLTALGGEAVEKHPTLIADSLAPHLRALVRLAAACVWPRSADKTALETEPGPSDSSAGDA